jgi:hypothetical protein
MEKNNEKYYYLNVEDTIKYGLVSAAIISRVQFWCEYNEKNKIKDRFYDGYWWSGYLTSKHLGEQLGISHKTIENHLAKLKQIGILIKATYNKKGFDRSSWYRVNPFTQNEEMEILKLEESIYPNQVNGNTQNEEMDLLELGEPIPDNPSVNSSVNTKSIKHSENPTLNQIEHHNTGANTQKEKRKEINNMLIELMNSLEYFNSSKGRLGILVQFLRDCKTENIQREYPKQLSERQLFLINELIGNKSFQLTDKEITNKVEKLIPLLNVKV